MTSSATQAATPATTAAAIGAAINLTGTTNLRSTAGYPAAGGRIREGALYRSDALHAIGAPGIAKLRGAGSDLPAGGGDAVNYVECDRLGTDR